MLKIRKPSGFTIVELLVTIAVLGISIPMIAGFVTSINAMNDHAQDSALITGLVENKIESIRSDGFIGTPSGEVDFTDELPETIESPRSATYTVTSPEVSLKQIDVDVTYESYGAQRNYSYTTFLGELGVGQY